MTKEELTKNNAEYSIMIGQALNLAMGLISEKSKEKCDVAEDVVGVEAKKIFKVLVNLRQNKELQQLYYDYKNPSQICDICKGAIKYDSEVDTKARYECDSCKKERSTK